MSALAPLPLAEPEEEFVVVHVHEDDSIDATLLHLPARRRGHAGRMWGDLDFPPFAWPSACGRVAAGWIYLRAGVFADTPVCPDCQAAA